MKLFFFFLSDQAQREEKKLLRTWDLGLELWTGLGNKPSNVLAAHIFPKKETTAADHKSGPANLLESITVPGFLSKTCRKIE